MTGASVVDAATGNVLRYCGTGTDLAALFRDGDDWAAGNTDRDYVVLDVDGVPIPRCPNVVELRRGPERDPEPVQSEGGKQVSSTNTRGITQL